VPEDVLGGQKDLIAEPLVYRLVEKQHACVHVHSSLVVQYLVAHHIGHSRHFGEASGLVAVLDV